MRTPLPLLLVGLCILGACKSSHDDPTESGDTPTDTQETGVPAQCGYIDIAMIWVPGGSFLMGSPPEEPGRDEDEEQHEVVLTHNFCISQHEITQRTYEEYFGSSPSGFADCGDNCPAESMTWHQAARFTNELSHMYDYEQCYDCEGAIADVTCQARRTDPYQCSGYRLPTEAEWEYAARGGETSAYPNGSDLLKGSEDICDDSVLLDNGSRLEDVAWYCGNAAATTHEVGGLIRNPLYLYDVTGNVAEWTHDWYSEVYSDTDTDPSGPSTGSWRVVKGGAWDSTPKEVRLGSRDKTSPDEHATTTGLRVVMTWDE